jgi:hypothetical protein
LPCLTASSFESSSHWAWNQVAYHIYRKEGEWTHYRGVRIYMVKRNIRSTTRRTFGIRLFPSFPSAIVLPRRYSPTWVERKLEEKMVAIVSIKASSESRK